MRIHFVIASCLALLSASCAPDSSPETVPAQPAVPTEETTSQDEPKSGAGTSHANKVVPKTDIARNSQELGAEIEDTRPRLLVPFYMNPGIEPGLTGIKQLVDASQRLKLDVVAIMNPNSGPGDAGLAEVEYTEAIQTAQAAGIKVIGYVYVNYGKNEVKPLVDIWYAKYPALDGIFVDGYPAMQQQVATMAELRRYIAKKSEQTFVVANPGTHIQEDYAVMQTADVFCVFENPAANFFKPERERLAWMNAYPDDRWACIGYAEQDETEMRRFVAKAIERHYEYIYVTDDVPPNQWDQMPSYWTELTEAIAAAQPE